MPRVTRRPSSQEVNIRKPRTSLEAQTLLQETLDSEGWRYAYVEFARTLNKLRTQILEGQDPQTIYIQVETLRNIKVMFRDVYNAAGIDMPPELLAYFS